MRVIFLGVAVLVAGCDGGEKALQTMTTAAEVAKPDVPAKAGRIQTGDRLHIRALGAPADEPLKGVFLVEPSGKVALGVYYGRAEVGGLTVEEAEERIRVQLDKVLREPHVQVTWYDPVAHGGPSLENRMAAMEVELSKIRDAVERLRKK